MTQTAANNKLLTKFWSGYLTTLLGRIRKEYLYNSMSSGVDLTFNPRAVLARRSGGAGQMPRSDDGVRLCRQTISSRKHTKLVKVCNLTGLHSQKLVQMTLLKSLEG